jgi:hypothetical protein
MRTTAGTHPALSAIMTAMSGSTPADRRKRAAVRRFASAEEADRHDLEYWRAIPEDERIVEVWRLSEEQWRLAGGDEPGLSRSVASVRRR